MTTTPSRHIQGLYEACIGISQAIEPIQYWSNFGYHITEQGSLSAEQAEQLYGVRSALTSIRLGHQQADHGLIRLMQWDQPLNEGLGTRSMKVVGNRWTAMITEDVMNIMNHVELAQSQAHDVYVVPPQWAVIYAPKRGGRAFKDPLIGVREMALMQPLSRQIFFQRFNYTVPHYGKVHPSSLFKSSQVTHFGILMQSDDESLVHFYSEVLGLIHVRDDEDRYESSIAGRAIFDLEPGDVYYTSDFDDPRSSKTDWTQARSGRLKVIRFPKHVRMENVQTHSNAGSLGLSLYTYRVKDIMFYHQKVNQSKATKVSEIMLDEFGQRAFSFQAPDGFMWTLIEDVDIP